MTELDPAVLPVVMPLVRRFLESAESATRDDLIAALTPAGPVERADDDRSRHVGPSVRALESLGILELRDGTLRLATPGLDESAFRLEVARRLLRVPDGVDPWQARANAQRLEYDLEVAVVWFCLQGLTPALRDFDSADRRLRAQLGGERNLLRDGAPYGTLERWVVWLGVGSRVVVGDAAALVPDPTPLFRSALDELAPRGKRVTAGEFLDASADLFPWLPDRRLGSVGGCEGPTRCPMTAPSIIGFPPAYPWRLCDSRGAEMSSSGPVTIRARGSRSELRAAVETPSPGWSADDRGDHSAPAVGRSAGPTAPTN